jgi:hypothetical protein
MTKQMTTMTIFGVKILQWNTNDYDDQKPVQKLCNGTQNTTMITHLFFFVLAFAREASLEKQCSFFFFLHS